MTPRTRGVVTLVATVVLVVLAVGCSPVSGGSTDDESGEPTAAEHVLVGNFSSLRVADGFQVRVERGAESRATISTSGIPEGQIEAVIDKNALELRTTNGSVPMGASLSADVVVPVLAGVTATSGARVVLLPGLTLGAPDAMVDLTAGASFDGEVSAESLEAKLQAGAVAQVSGSAGKASINGSEAGVFDAVELVVSNAFVNLSSGATAELTVTKTLDVSLSSGSKFVYSGSPKITGREIKSGAVLESSGN